MRAVAVPRPPRRVRRVPLQPRAGPVRGGLAPIPPQREAVHQAAMLLVVRAAVRVVAVAVRPCARRVAVRAVHRAAAAERFRQLLHRIVILGIACVDGLFG